MKSLWIDGDTEREPVVQGPRQRRLASNVAGAGILSYFHAWQRWEVRVSVLPHHLEEAQSQANKKKS